MNLVPKMKICSTCGHAGMSVTTTKGSMAIELVLWICFIIPGLIYSLWRMSSKHPACSLCASPAIVPLASPSGLTKLKAGTVDRDRLIAEAEQWASSRFKRSVIISAVIAFFSLAFIGKNPGLAVVALIGCAAWVFMRRRASQATGRDTGAALNAVAMIAPTA